MPDMERNCPICKIPMSVEHRYSIDIDVCRSHGVWLDNGELARLTKTVQGKPASTIDEAEDELARRTSADPKPSRDKLVCPVCRGPMHSRLIMNQNVWMCRAHGFWLDKAALAGMLRALREKQPYSSGSVPVVSDVVDILDSYTDNFWVQLLIRVLLPSGRLWWF